jgi:hypothetical protein
MGGETREIGRRDSGATNGGDVEFCADSSASEPETAVYGGWCGR